MRRPEFIKRDIREYQNRPLGGRLLILGSNFLAGAGLLALIGNWLDHRTGHAYLYTLIGLFLGLAWATYEAFKMAYLLSAEPDLKKEGHHEASGVDPKSDAHSGDSAGTC